MFQTTSNLVDFKYDFDTVLSIVQYCLSCCTYCTMARVSNESTILYYCASRYMVQFLFRYNTLIIAHVLAFGWYSTILITYTNIYFEVTVDNGKWLSHKVSGRNSKRKKNQNATRHTFIVHCTCLILYVIHKYMLKTNAL